VGELEEANRLMMMMMAVAVMMMMPCSVRENEYEVELAELATQHEAELTLYVTTPAHKKNTCHSPCM